MEEESGVCVLILQTNAAPQRSWAAPPTASSWRFIERIEEVLCIHFTQFSNDFLSVTNFAKEFINSLALFGNVCLGISLITKTVKQCCEVWPKVEPAHVGFNLPCPSIYLFVYLQDGGKQITFSLLVF